MRDDERLRLEQKFAKFTQVMEGRMKIRVQNAVRNSSVSLKSVFRTHSKW